MDREEVKKKVTELFEQQVEQGVCVTADDTIEMMGGDSLDSLDVLMEAERFYGVCFSEEDWKDLRREFTINRLTDGIMRELSD